MRIKIPVISFLLLVVVSALIAFVVNSHNLRFLEQKGIETRHHQTIKTADDKSYLSPVKMYLKNGLWKENQKGKSSYYKRSPGYGLFVLPHFVIFEPSQAFFSIKLSQCLLHGIIAGGLFLSFLYFKISKGLAFALASVYGVFPVFYGYVFYTLTEGITAFLLFVLFFIYLIKPFKKHILNFVGVCIVFSYLLLTRPVFGLFLFVPFAIWYKFNFHFKYSLGFIGLILCFIPYGIWTERNLKISQESLTFHPVYDSGNETIWRLPHQSIYELVKLYNPNPADYHSWNRKLWSAAKKEKPFDEIHDPTSIFSEQVLKTVGKDTIRFYTELYYNTLIEVPGFSKHEKYSNDEKLVSTSFLNFRKEYAKKFFIESHFKTPLLVLKDVIFTSNLNLQVFWRANSNSFFVQVLRYIAVILHLLIFIIPFVGFVIDFQFLKKYWAVFVGTSAYLFYLIYIQRGLENRYTFPLLPLLYCLTVILLYKLYLKLFKSRNPGDVGSSNQ